VVKIAENEDEKVLRSESDGSERSKEDTEGIGAIQNGSRKHEISLIASLQSLPIH
jgi:hypothetical protein